MVELCTITISSQMHIVRLFSCAPGIIFIQPLNSIPIFLATILEWLINSLLLAGCSSKCSIVLHLLRVYSGFPAGSLAHISGESELSGLY